MQKEFSIGTTPVYNTYPDNGTRHPGIILIEEIWGLNDHIKEVADRFAKEGYVVLAPELLPSDLRTFLTPELQRDLFDPEKRDTVQPKLREAMQPIQQPAYAHTAITALKACIEYLYTDAHVSSVAAVGFCFGGTYAFHIAAQDARVHAAVPFYGQPPSTDEIPHIQGPILSFYGDQDTHLMQTLPELKEQMLLHHKTFEAIVYPGAGHAFFNDTNVRMYNASAAADAWQKTLVFLKQNLI